MTAPPTTHVVGEYIQVGCMTMIDPAGKIVLYRLPPRRTWWRRLLRSEPPRLMPTGMAAGFLMPGDQVVRDGSLIYPVSPPAGWAEKVTP